MKDFVVEFQRNNRDEHLRVVADVRRELRRKHFQTKPQRVCMMLLLFGLQAKESEVDDAFFETVFNSRPGLAQNLSMRGAGDSLSSFSERVQKFWNDLDFLELGVSMARQADREQRTNLKHRFLEVFKIYNESIQELVEGQREVMHDPSHTLHDGQTVQDKLDQFKANLDKALRLASAKVSNELQSESAEEIKQKVEDQIKSHARDWKK